MRVLLINTAFIQYSAPVRIRLEFKFIMPNEKGKLISEYYSIQAGCIPIQLMDRLNFTRQNGLFGIIVGFRR